MGKDRLVPKRWDLSLASMRKSALLLALMFVVGLSLPAYALDVTLSGPDSGCENFTLVVTFSEAVSGFDETDLVLSDATVGTASTLDNIVFTVPVFVSGATTTVNLPADSAFNAVPEGNTAANSFFYSVNPPWSGGTANGSFVLTYTFSKPVTGLELSDFVLSEGTADSLTGGPEIYEVTITPPSDASGILTVDIPADSAFDVCSSGNVAAPQRCIPFDTTSGAGEITIATQPLSVVANPGDTVQFSVGDISGGNPPYAYEWYFSTAKDVNGVSNVSGIFDATLFINGVNNGGNNNVGNYYCVVTDSTSPDPLWLQSNTATLSLHTAIPLAGHLALAVVSGLLAGMGALATRRKMRG